MTQPLWEDDVTVRVSTEPIELKPGEPVVHKYLLYNGPVKVMLLDQAETAAEAVDAGAGQPATRDDLNLNTLTDYQSASWIGNITGPTWHQLDADPDHQHHALGAVVPARLPVHPVHPVHHLPDADGARLMFPVSRKQAMTSMQDAAAGAGDEEAAGEVQGRQAGLAAAQMELYRKHGVNPFGTCWLLLLQMPIFMGLYYSLAGEHPLPPGRAVSLVVDAEPVGARHAAVVEQVHPVHQRAVVVRLVSATWGRT